jgi:hypothetical protein
MIEPSLIDTLDRSGIKLVPQVEPAVFRANMPRQRVDIECDFGGNAHDRFSFVIVATRGLKH